jgi:hypothetical protein
VPGTTTCCTSPEKTSFSGETSSNAKPDMRLSNPFEIAPLDCGAHQFTPLDAT